MSTIQTFDFSVNILRSLLWRNNESVNLQALMQDKQDYFNTNNEDFWTNWITDVFDLRTANIFGLNVWSIILGLSITVEPTPDPTFNDNWGFGPNRKNFENGNFSSAISEFSLNAADARVLLRLRYYQLTTNGNVTDINLILADVFGSIGPAFVTDNNDMTIQYTLPSGTPSTLQLVLDAFDILPRPSGVESSFVIV